MILTALAPAALLLMQATTATEEAKKGTRNYDNVPEGTFEIDKKKVRCKYERSVNSRIPTKVCYTLEEWEMRKKQQEEEMRGMRNRNSACGSEGPC